MLNWTAIELKQLPEALYHRQVFTRVAAFHNLTDNVQDVFVISYMQQMLHK